MLNWHMSLQKYQQKFVMNNPEVGYPYTRIRMKELGMVLAGCVAFIALHL